MNEDLKKAIIKALEKNHRNGPITARNLVGIYESIIADNQNLSPAEIASLINEADVKSDSEDEEED